MCEAVGFCGSVCGLPMNHDGQCRCGICGAVWNKNREQKVTAGDRIRHEAITKRQQVTRLDEGREEK